MISRLIVIRHGKPLSDGFAEDGLRPLSNEGRIVQRQMAERLKALGISPGLILTSPLLRAVQSAEIVGEVFEAPVEEESALGEEFDAEVVLGRILPGKTIAIVGHMPTLPQLVEKLVGKPVLPDGICKSGMVILSFKDKIGWGKAHFENYLKQ